LNIIDRLKQNNFTKYLIYFSMKLLFEWSFI
jgi:hypothetical protein